MRLKSLRYFDFILLATSLALVAYGTVLIYSGSLASYGSSAEVLSHPVARQIGFAAVGVAAMVVMSRLDYRALGYAAVGLYVAALAALAFVLLVGESAYGSRRWIDVGGTLVQPSEIAKLVLIVALAKFLADRQDQMGRPRVFLTSLAIALVPAALVFAEPDLGSAVIFGAIWLGMVIMAGARSRHVLTLLGAAIVSVPFVLVAVMSDYQRERLALFLDPAKDSLGSGFNILQSEISIGSGGLLGQGLTHGTQTQLDYLQTQTTDYVFSVLGEELGLVGALVLFALFIILLFRVTRVAGMSRDPFGRLMATGIVIFILFQVFINVGVNVRLIPVTGIPLPFISQGGSSLLTLFVALGILQSILLRHRQVDFSA
jgi:rod shape determining protein RodA